MEKYRESLSLYSTSNLKEMQRTNRGNRVPFVFCETHLVARRKDKKVKTCCCSSLTHEWHKPINFDNILS